jgi:hypothetical protein
MPQLQVSPQTAQAAHKLASHQPGAPDIALHRRQMAAKHATAKARAKEISDREPHLVSAFVLGEVIAQIEADQILHGERGELTESMTLNRVLARLAPLLTA